MMNNQGRPTRPAAAKGADKTTYTGHQGLQFHEPLIFEMDAVGRKGVDVPAIPAHQPRLGAMQPRRQIGLPGLSEPQVVRHFTRLSQKNFAIDSAMYPLGSCTMKHNPRLNEKLARLPGFGDLHPLQHSSTTQGALELMHELGRWLCTLTNMPAVSLAPAAGAHGEFCGMLAIRAALDAAGEKRNIVLVPESAHGTNPATAAALGFSVQSIPANAAGRVDVAAFKEKLNKDVAAIMLTNPNTCGLFENDIIEIAAAVRAIGGYFYCDGANFNAIAGRVRPGDLGVDAMHINLHKTFSTPHGGGGPGSGPVVFSERLAPFVPYPFVVQGKDGQFQLVEDDQAGTHGRQPIGRLKAFHGQMGMFIRALAHMMSHGADGLWQASTDAVLNANYIMARLKDVMTPAFDAICMHEALFDDRFLKDSGVTTLDWAKAMLDEGFHPMTMYFPLVVKGAMLIEPTETESKETLDQFIGMMRHLAEQVKAGNQELFTSSPSLTPVRRLDETLAARKPVLRWTPPVAENAEKVA